MVVDTGRVNNPAATRFCWLSSNVFFSTLPGQFDVRVLTKQPLHNLEEEKKEKRRAKWWESVIFILAGEWVSLKA
jgi:hypothetical protein